MIDAGLYALLSADAGVSALVGARIYRAAAPPDASQYPCISYSFVGGSSELTLKTSGVTKQRVELNGLALASATCEDPSGTAAAIRAAIIAALDGWSQMLGDGANVLDAQLLNPGIDFCTEDRVFRCLVEFYVFYTLPS